MKRLQKVFISQSKTCCEFISAITTSQNIANVTTIKRNIFTSRLRQCLTTRHIIFLGVGNMIGCGLYKLTGKVIREITGPAIIICYILVGLAAVLSAMCYSELESRIPVAGSAYSFTYTIIGEVVAFVVGWHMILESMIGAAALAKSWSETFDNLLDYSIRNATIATIGQIKDYTGSTLFDNIYGPDILAAIIVLLASFLICSGAERSANFISCFAISNLLIITVIIGYGLSMADVSLWTTSVAKCASNATSGNSAFLPYGPGSIIRGSDKIFFAYIGFDRIASAGEEAKNPQKCLPQGTMISIILVGLVYILMTVTLTLLVPFCDISPTTGFASAFLYGDHKSRIMFVAVTIGSLCAMSTVLFGILFSMPRTIYAMSSDGLLFRAFKTLNPRTQTPMWGSVVFGSLSSLLALCIPLDVLVGTKVITVLSNFSIVACCVLMLRYREDSAKIGARHRTTNVDIQKPGGLKKGYKFLAGLLKFFPTVNRPVSFLVLVCLVPSLFCLAAVTTRAQISSNWFLPLFVLFLLCSVTAVFLIHGRQQSQAELHFKVPFLPFVPALSLFLNFLIINNTLYSTPPGPSLIHYMQIVWFSIGMVIYFAYGKRHSKAHTKKPPAEICFPDLRGHNTNHRVSETSFNFQNPIIVQNDPVVHPQVSVSAAGYTFVGGDLKKI